jgi:SAM-dependent methyltransferase
MTDAWSEIMKDAAAGIAGEYFIEREDGKVETLQVLEYVKPFAEWSEVERLAMKHIKGKVLDIGCGLGRVALHLQNLGFQVVGIDLAKGAIEACKKLGLREAYIMSAENLDFPDAEFNTVLLFGNNFGILGSEEKTIEMLQNLHRITSEEGIILAGAVDVEQTDDPEHLNYHDLNLSRGRPKGLVRLRVKYKGNIDEWIDLYHALPGEMDSMAIKAGWKLKKKYQTGSAYVGVLTKS